MNDIQITTYLIRLSVNTHAYKLGLYNTGAHCSLTIDKLKDTELKDTEKVIPN